MRGGGNERIEESKRWVVRVAMKITSYKIFIVGEESDFVGNVKKSMSEIFEGMNISFETAPENTEYLKEGDLIVFDSDKEFPGIIKSRARNANIPLVLLNREDEKTASFSVEEPIFFGAVNSSPRSVAEFLSLILLFQRRLKELAELESLKERMELLDDVIVDFGSTLNSKLCTIIGYADFALSEASNKEMQNALQIALEAGLDTAQLLQNMLLSAKAIIRKDKKKKWAA